ncbi:MAG TPA: 3-oxoacyl-ACP reductase family protein [Gemmatales bacterium]|nr:3-oxoacyl-ACP reductase family protein [Gemmatales bacterium]HMP59179.1 3-oxoacyl-ACP reductase family protein [Gemmatales bacterium]
MRLKDKVAIVTGGGRGIGRAVCLAFAAEGAKVLVVYRGSKDAAEAVVADITAQGGMAEAEQVDVADPAAAAACVARIAEKWGRVDILVNNAGIIKDGLFIQMDPANWDAVLKTNLGGTFNFCRPCAELMFRQRGGRIINISSVAADRVNRGQANYVASKGAINALTKAMAVELASRGVLINAIAPGFIETDMSEAVRNVAGDTIKKLIPVRRFGKPEDIAKVAVFLASDDSSYVTGQVLTVDGGLSLGAMSA